MNVLWNFHCDRGKKRYECPSRELARLWRGIRTTGGDVFSTDVPARVVAARRRDEDQGAPRCPHNAPTMPPAPQCSQEPGWGTRDRRRLEEAPSPSDSAPATILQGWNLPLVGSNGCENSQDLNGRAPRRPILASPCVRTAKPDRCKKTRSV